MTDEDDLRAQVDWLRKENEILRQQISGLEQAGLAPLLTSWQEHPSDDLETQILLLKTLLDTIPDTVYVKNIRSQKMYANMADARLCGVENPAELIGKTDYDTYPPDIASFLIEEEQEIFRTGEPVISAEQPLILTSGEKVWLLTSKVPLRNEDGQVIGLVGMGRNVTERKNAQDALAQAHVELRLWVAELEQRHNQAHLLNELSKALLGCYSEDQVYGILPSFMELIFQRYPGGLCMFAEPTPENEQQAPKVMAIWGEEKDLPQGQMKHSCSFAEMGLCRLQDGHLVHFALGIAADGDDDQNRLPGGRLLKPDVCLPLDFQGRTQGALFQHFPLAVQPGALGHDLDPRLRLENWQQLASSAAERFSTILTNLHLAESLRNQSIRDPLTGLFNRRYLEETLEREVHRALRSRQSLWLFMIDLDNFKPVNDTLGHVAGDMLLRRLGHYFLQHVRAEDTPCRYGGDEFVILLYGLSSEAALARAESLRVGAVEMLRETGLPLEKPVSMSIGLACIPLHSANSAALLRTADRALYRAKNAGRNQSVLFS
jgi:diguanylate cyclase (GGDEF)-like protein/PAS domain S-box-containing protein